jgi:hypothetical protein
MESVVQTKDYRTSAVPSSADLHFLALAGNLGDRMDYEMYTYAQVENALMQVFNIREEDRGMLRGRIKNMQRLKLAPETPGKGKRIIYGFESVWTWAVFLELSEFGIDPTKILQIIAGPVLARWSDHIDALGEDRYAILHPFFMSKWNDAKLGFGGRIGSDILNASEISSEVIDQDGVEGRASIFNISRLRRELKAALDRVAQGGA